MSKLSAPKGTQDLLPEVTPMWQAIETLFRETVQRYGYGEIRIPTFELTELFQRGVGDDTDVVQKEMYTFEDKGGRSLTLRPEGTAGVVRAFIENGRASQPMPQRYYYNITAFRYENVQKGRMREFHQLGVEAFGAKGPAIDAEMITMLQRFFERLGLADLDLRINNLGTPESRAEYLELLKDYLRPRREELCDDCQERLERNPLRVLDCKNRSCQQVTADAPLMADHLDASSQAHFAGVQARLDDLGIAYTVDKRIVRGLDYYTDTVFEFVSEHVGTQGTICGGGRYDVLMKQLGGPDTPGLGFALGMERLLMELDARGLDLTLTEQPDLSFVTLSEEAERRAAQVADKLRQEGHYVEIDLMDRSLKAQMKFANKQGARYTLVIGDDELTSGRAVLHPMGEGTDLELEWQDSAALSAALAGRGGH